MEVLVAPITRSPEYHPAPSSPSTFGELFNYRFHFTSAPTSPARAVDIYHHLSQMENSPANHDGDDSMEFAFDSGSWSEISAADELFEKGRIRPLHPLPPTGTVSASPRGGERGRQRAASTSTSGNIARESRSLSPSRNLGYFIKNTTSTAAPAVGGSKKWRLKDLLLFRSASEGRATGRRSRDPLRKYTLLSSLSSSTSRKKGEEDSRFRGFGLTESAGSGSVRRGSGPAASAHEIHYAANRAAAEEQRKKTPLPYQRHGLFGCFQFNPAIRHFAKGLSGHSSSRGRS